MARVLEVPVEAIDDEASPDTIDNWDSLRHMNLVMALEEEFGVQFSTDEVIELLNFRLIVLTLQDKL